MQTTSPLTIGVLFGGRSGEHEVSLESARSVLAALDRKKYRIVEIGITKEGAWFSGENALEALAAGNTVGLTPVTLLPDPTRPGLRDLQNGERIAHLDVVFPVLHGTFGEDGTLQGLLEMADLAYVGPGVAGSAVGMDKDLFKAVMRANDIPVVDWVILRRSEIEKDIQKTLTHIETALNGHYPLFVKPANLGSSVGITKCRTRSDLYEGLLEAARYDRRILVEKGLNAREIEISVLGNDEPQASIPGEIRPAADFYTYEAKYHDDRSELLIPAPLPETESERLRNLAVRAYKAIDCAGMARVDFLLDRDTGQAYLNEVNTIPGFTQISMYPKLWEASGLPYAQLLDRLITLALERKAERAKTIYRRES
ncbi:MAG: D-alanine--D-alanine ligase [Anaerolineae bacterium]|nr:MAG: D-alanine--D-alanine ligase [Anaerolineae bacterium]